MYTGTTATAFITSYCLASCCLEKKYFSILIPVWSRKKVGTHDFVCSKRLAGLVKVQFS